VLDILLKDPGLLPVMSLFGGAPALWLPAVDFLLADTAWTYPFLRAGSKPISIPSAASIVNMPGAYGQRSIIPQVRDKTMLAPPPDLFPFQTKFPLANGTGPKSQNS
jgi:hypothetical protein